MTNKIGLQQRKNPKHSRKIELSEAEDEKMDGKMDILCME